MIKNKLIRNAIINAHAQGNCKHATFLIEKKENTRLTFREWWAMQLHLAICPLCTLYKSQSQLLQQMMVKIFHNRKDRTISMDEARKEALEKLIEERLK
ncbi:MAG: hypothetical protein DI598_20545 [Pseudopedobacter saltans]|uniref:Zinc-finger domain-containing protein n=1 Tax=Pseudopedobacter saltans TaxID=151895 RepID=A0A2W5E6P4_9SPHI|nr:MAG: hypothetical protein DI598_20545 [Pseudopedobacter saltans]